MIENLLASVVVSFFASLCGLFVSVTIDYRRQILGYLMFLTVIRVQGITSVARFRFARFALFRRFGAPQRIELMAAQAEELDLIIASISKELNAFARGEIWRENAISGRLQESVVALSYEYRRGVIRKLMAVLRRLNTEYYEISRRAKGTKLAIAGDLFSIWRDAR